MGNSWDASGIAYDVSMWKEALRVLKPGGYLLAFSSARTYHWMTVAIEKAGFEIRDQIMWIYGNGFPKNHTMLKPAHEPICVARKRIKGSVSANVSKHGTGTLRTDVCRLSSGRFPTNVVHDGSDETESVFAKFGESKSRKGKPRGSAKPGEGWGMTKTGAEYNDEGTPARFFYCAKASKKDRNEGEVSNDHPTVKPTELMRYLVRLVTPPDGIVLDPFMGSGSTGKAAMLEGFKFAGIDMTPEYVDLSHARISHALSKAKK
jgi:site-specific DNA-methyltransferase (adenine-specific)